MIQAAMEDGLVLEFKKPSIFLSTVIVNDEKTLRLLFSHRLASGCYSRNIRDPKSKKLTTVLVKRKRPQLGNEGKRTDGFEGDPSKDLVISSGEGRKEPILKVPRNQYDLKAASLRRQDLRGGGKHKLAGDVPGDYREKLRSRLTEEQSLDRVTVDEFSANVVLPMRLLPEEVRTGVDVGLIRLECQSRSGRLWRAIAVSEDEKDGRPLAPDLISLRLDKWNYPVSKFEHISWNVFREVWSRGWIVTKGANFGCDFLLYVGDPGTTHSSFMICVSDHEQDTEGSSHVRWSAIAALATKVRKTALLASVEEDDVELASRVTFTLLEGCLFRRADFLSGRQQEIEALEEERLREELRERRENPQVLEDTKVEEFADEFVAV